MYWVASSFTAVPVGCPSYLVGRTKARRAGYNTLHVEDYAVSDTWSKIGKCRDRDDSVSCGSTATAKDVGQ
jgi:hypothetical protein